MSELQNSFEQISHQFIQDVLKVVAGSSIRDIANTASQYEGEEPSSSASMEHFESREVRSMARGGTLLTRGALRRPRRSTQEVTQLAQELVEMVKNSERGLAISDLAQSLQIPVGELTRPLAIALREKRIRKSGDKRSTRYFPV